jgi:hypothetical protein
MALMAFVGTVVWLVLGFYAWYRYCVYGPYDETDDGELISMLGVIMMGPLCLIGELFKNRRN